MVSISSKTALSYMFKLSCFRGHLQFRPAFAYAHEEHIEEIANAHDIMCTPNAHELRRHAISPWLGPGVLGLRV